MRGRIIGGIACLAAAVAPSGMAAADALTRSSCWTFKFEADVSRTLCFSGASRVTMRNRNRVANSDTFSRCEWTGDYARRDDKVTVTFAQGSGKCSNGAASPQFTVVCTFDGASLACEGSAVVDRKTYEFSGTFE